MVRRADHTIKDTGIASGTQDEEWSKRRPHPTRKKNKGKKPCRAEWLCRALVVGGWLV
jgi:hypothetical protein